MNLQVALRFTLLLWVGSLFALLALQRLLLDPLPAWPTTIAVFLGQVAPLLIVTPGALQTGSRGPLWVALVMLLYFVHGIWQWSEPTTRLVGTLEAIFALGAFVTSWTLLKVMPKDGVSP